MLAFRYAVLKIRTEPGPSPPVREERDPGRVNPRPQARIRRHGTPVPSGPSSVLTQPPDQQARSATPQGSVLTAASRGSKMNSQRSTRQQWTPTRTSARRKRQLLLRKEVIQPHLPVRLPCYDFVPIADPTFDGSLPYGLGRRLRVLPTFVT